MLLPWFRYLLAELPIKKCQTSDQSCLLVFNFKVLLLLNPEP